MMINKAYKFRLYPNQKQKELINKTFGCTRLVYNYYLDKKIKGSHNYYKLKKIIARIYKKIKNARKYLIHHIAKDITDASFSEIIRQLEYKTKWKGKKLYTIATYYPSSQICSHCGYKNTLLKNLNIREYTCPNCQYELDRDYNASVNIMFEGLELYMNEIRA